jgi:hypothetical protein
MPNKLVYSIEKGLRVQKTPTSHLDPEVRRSMSYISARKKPRWFYSGDRDIQNGGYFYNLDNWKWGYVEAWRVTPFSDAGGHDNQFWLEELTVNVDPKLHDSAMRDSALNSCGWIEDGSYEKASVRERRHMLVDAYISVGYYDRNSQRVIQIGPRPDEMYGGREEPLRPDVTLRSNVDLKKWLRAHVNAL